MTRIRESRLRLAAQAAQLQPAGPPRRIDSHSNDTWLIQDRRHGATVLRICWRGDRRRMLREAAIGARLPAEVGYPEVLGSGWAEGGLTWLLTARLHGQTVTDAWPKLSQLQHRHAAEQLAGRLRALHSWRPPPELVDELLAETAAARRERAAHAMAIVGTAMNPLPDDLARLIELMPALGRAAALLAAPVAAEVDRLSSCLPILDDPERTGLVHGDLHLGNLWWDGRQVSCLLDLEWARFAEPYTDLARMIDNVEADRGGGGGHPFVLKALRQAYPELFDVDGLDQRLRLVRIAYQVRQLFGMITVTPSAADHPLVVLHRLVNR